MVNVPEVQFNAFFNAGISAVTVHLGPAGHTGFHLVFDHVVGDGILELFHEMGEFRTGTDQAHIAFQDIDELGKFIQAGLPEESTELCPAGIFVCCPGRILFVILPHGTELQHFELFPLVTDPCLLEEDRAGAGSLDPDGNDEKQWTEQDEPDQVGDQVEGSFHDRPAQVLQAVHPHVDQLAVANGLDGRVSRNDIVVKGDDGVFHTVLFTSRDDRPEAVIFFRIQGDNHFVDIRRCKDFVQVTECTQVLVFFCQEIPVPDETQQVKTQFRFCGDIVLVLLGKLSRTDDHHVLEVVAFPAEAAQHQPHEGVFTDQEDQGDNIECQDNATGEVHQAEDEEYGCRDQSGKRDRKEDGPDLPGELPYLGSIVESEQGEQEGEHQGISQGKQQGLLADPGHVAAVSVKEVQPDPGGQDVGKNDQQHIQDDVHPVQKRLVLADQLPVTSFLLICCLPCFVICREDLSQAGFDIPVPLEAVFKGVQHGFDSYPVVFLLVGNIDAVAFGGFVVFLVQEEFLVEFLAGAQTGTDNLFLAGAIEADHLFRKILDLYGFAHVQDEELPAPCDGNCLQNQRSCFRDRHEVADDIRVGEGYRAAGPDLLFEDRDDRTVGTQDVAEADRHELGVPGRDALDDDLCQAFARTHDVGGVDGLVGRDQDKAFDVTFGCDFRCFVGSENVVQDCLLTAGLHQRNMFVCRGVDHNVGLVFTHDPPEALLVPDGTDFQNNGVGDQFTVFLLQFEKEVVHVVFGDIVKNQFGGGEGQDLAAQLRAN